MSARYFRASAMWRVSNLERVCPGHQERSGVRHAAIAKSAFSCQSRSRRLGLDREVCTKETVSNSLRVRRAGKDAEPEAAAACGWADHHCASRANKARRRGRCQVAEGGRPYTGQARSSFLVARLKDCFGSRAQYWWMTVETRLGVCGGVSACWVGGCVLN